MDRGHPQLPTSGAPRLAGSYSTHAGAYFFPRREVCPVSGELAVPVLLSSSGVLYSWTYVFEASFGEHTRDDHGYGVALVDLPEGVRVQGRLIGAIGDWEIGMVVEAQGGAEEIIDGTDRLLTFAVTRAGISSLS